MSGAVEWDMATFIGGGSSWTYSFYLLPILEQLELSPYVLLSPFVLPEPFIMIVKCITTSVESLPTVELRKHVKQHVHLAEIDLTIGQCYPVFGVQFRDGIPWFLLCENSNDDYPTPYCAALFELIDRNIAHNWQLSLSNSNVGAVAILPDQWAADPQFLEKLIERDGNAVSFFQSLKKKCQF